MICAVVLTLCAIGAHSLTFSTNDVAVQLHSQPELMMFEKSGYPRKGVVNLDDPPVERWKNIISLYRDETIPYLVQWQSILDTHTEIDQAAWGEALKKNYDKDHLNEIQGIFETINDSRVTETNLLLFQAMYELGSPMACSEVIAAGPDGSVIHGRNLDYRVISPVIEITFQKNGAPLFVAPQYLAQIGQHTAIKINRWSFGQNTRGVSGDTVAQSLDRVKAGAKVFQNFVRSLLEQDLSYDAVVKEMQDVQLLKDMYFNIAGAGSYEGTVLARAADPSYKHSRVLSQNPKTWFLFQTNDDWDAPPADLRRPTGVLALNMLRQDRVTPTSIRQVMMSAPIYVPANVVLFMMAPKAGKFCSVLGAMNNDDTSIDEGECGLVGWNTTSR